MEKHHDIACRPRVSSACLLQRCVIGRTSALSDRSVMSATGTAATRCTTSWKRGRWFLPGDGRFGGSTQRVPRFHRCAVRRALHAARISIDERLEELERMRRRVGFQLEMNERARLLSDGRLRPGFPSMARLVETSTTTRSVNGACSWGMRNSRGSRRRGAAPRACRSGRGGRSVRGVGRRGHGTGDGDVALPDGAQGASDACALLWRIEDVPRAPSGSRPLQTQLRAGREPTPSICSTRRVRWGCS